MSSGLLTNIYSSMRKLRGVMLLSALLSAGVAEATAPPAGSVILNTASATYEVPAVDPSGVTRSGTVTSNTVEATTNSSYVPPTLTKSASVANSTAGGTISYTLNIASGSALTAAAVSVNGSNRQLIVVRDVIPANTSFVVVQQDAGSQVLYQVSGAGADQYQTTAPSDLSTVAAIAFGFQTLAPNSTTSVQFQVKVSQRPNGDISNTGVINATLNGNPGTVPSNPVVVTVPPLPGALEYRDSGLTNLVTVSSASFPLNLYAAAAVCNADPAQAESYFVTLTTKLSKDIEAGSAQNPFFEMTETGPNTGIFTLSNIPTKLATAVPNSGTVEVAVNDVVDATLICGQNTLQASVMMNPAGVVYDSSSDKPVADAQVLLVDMSGNQKALYTVTTGPDGVFQFPLVNPGNYSFVVLPPKGYKFPSTSSNRYPDRRIGLGSFGETFAAKDASAMAQDIPLDLVPTGLTVEKQASQDTVEIGESVSYTLTVHNGTINDLNDVVVDDTLPIGFTYIAGSARINNTVLANPDVTGDRKLSFKIGALGKGISVKLTYAVTVGTGAPRGNGINSAQAHGVDLTAPAGSPPVVSNVATAKVKIDKGVFSDEALIVGKIFVDCNRDDLQGKEELGIPGVRLYLDDGSFVISDEEGKYSFYGVSPRTHVLKIDRTTLPPGSEMATVSNRNAGDPQSLFVDLKNGEMHRADFAEGSCTPEILAEVKKRRKAGQVLNAKIEDEAFLKPLRTIEESLVDPRSRPASGIIGADGQIVAETPLIPVNADSNNVAPLAGSTAERSIVSPLGEAPVSRVASVNVEALLPKLKDNKFGFLDLKDGDTLAGTDLSVRIVGQDGGSFRLFVNGEEVPTTRVGQRARMPSRNMQVWEYIAVKLKPGVNTLRAENQDAFGNKRDSASISLTAPGTPGQLKIVLPPDGAVADGQTPARIMVRLFDDKGTAVTARTFITLESTAGRWDVEDFDPKQPGVQTVIQGGEAVFDLIPPSNPGHADLRVSSGVIEDTASLPLDPHLRPLIASGIIEGAVGFNKLDSKSISPATPADGFEQDIKNLSTGNGDGTQAGIRGSMFLKGKVKGNYLLTLAYDSDKDTQERLFRDIDPENYYPVYGDSSIKGFDAQSTSKLYVRVDKGRSFLLYGDFNTNDAPDQARQLSNYSRSLTGVRQHYENDKVVVNLFASHQTSQQQSTEFRAQGISGPYLLPGKGFLTNSEKIEIVTRSREQPSLVVSTVPMTRFIDYTIDEVKGSIIFTSPVAGVDTKLNPVFIRVTWEVDNGGDAFWVYGADGRYRLTKFLEVGASVVRDNAPDAAYTLYGANATLDLARNSKATVEVAHSQDDTTGEGGTAWRAELTQTGGANETRAYASKSDSSFHNPNAALSSGSTDAGIKSGWQLTESLRLGAEGLYSDSSDQGNGKRAGIFTNVEYALTKNLKASLGLRFTHQDEAAATATPAPGAADATSDITSINAKAIWSPDFMPKASVFTEYEQSVNEPSAKMLGVGGTYQIADRSRIYARHELISSETGPFGLSELVKDRNTTAVGIDYDYMSNANAFSEYRVRDALDGGAAEAALGLRNGWNLSPGIKLKTQFERVQPLSSGDNSQNSLAASVGLQYTGDPLLRLGTRLEWRKSSSETSILNTVALARKLSLDWSMLAKNTLSWTDNGAPQIDAGAGLIMTGPTIRDRLRVGAAWRQTDSNEWAWLGLFETRYDRDPTIQQTRTAYVVSSNVNYQPHRQWVLNGRYAAKWVNEKNVGISNRFIGNLVSGRVMFDISEKWDAGVVSSVVFDQSNVQYSVGAEVGYLMTSNLWLSGGYNFAGYQDRDFNDSNYTRQGPYVRLRFKFDEELFRWLE